MSEEDDNEHYSKEFDKLDTDQDGYINYEELSNFYPDGDESQYLENTYFPILAVDGKIDKNDFVFLMETIKYADEDDESEKYKFAYILIEGYNGSIPKDDKILIEFIKSDKNVDDDGAKAIAEKMVVEDDTDIIDNSEFIKIMRHT
ncbi:hypothetical protein EIN_529230 [Entamoeba invadens IP1]|uniref:EF-hand domain-containing protein n=1 Tax=Entamoeba invadens IP1 TaxID=370355 RepID=L7FP82_ENTIV|nr:hypothetical protein EIN_529230 [Entamoeba invadens IP1]ELP94382.1 hypothetical protein EIN_529230 [Entamoeba invadens IP1]|eukprot:XP_004261153.1 hypothetical protein EIN_529230 [Entamoeba invadens IP1]